MQKDNSLEALYFARALFSPKRKIAGRFLRGGRKNQLDRSAFGRMCFVTRFALNNRDF